MTILLPKKKCYENKAKAKNKRQAIKDVQGEGQMTLWTTSLSAVLVLLLMAYGTYRLNDELRVSQWDIQAEDSLQQQIEAFLQAQDNMSFWQSRASIMQAKMLQAMPDIERMEVRRVLPDALHIQAIARIPLALWAADGKQAVLLVDQRGKAYRALRAGEVMDLPLFRLAATDLKQAVKLLQKLQQDTGKIAHLSEVIVEQQRWRLNFSHGEQWQLLANSLEQDLGRIMSILEQPRWRHGYWRMDARIPQRWFIRPAMQEVI